jgi:hypothetical protein
VVVPGHEGVEQLAPHARLGVHRIGQDLLGGGVRGRGGQGHAALLPFVLLQRISRILTDPPKGSEHLKYLK